ncbi:hypothetical protein EV421DRAFT_1737211 [Armillaria borealis]|uniref:Uncharacterized protein n=1 Tax=Armillaria borealis TaxID=47425 RepID=A0AA39JD25_9AGAR|nr:hypothetical protein EV421DRAFT_1737211 [Armillaria borealis]
MAHIDVDENLLAAALAMVRWQHPSAQLYHMPQYTPFEISLQRAMNANLRNQAAFEVLLPQAFDTNFRLQKHRSAHTPVHCAIEFPDNEAVERFWSHVVQPGAMTVYREDNPHRVFFLSHL